MWIVGSVKVRLDSWLVGVGWIVGLMKVLLDS